MQTQGERKMRPNMKKILEEMSKGSEYKLTANGRILKNEHHYHRWAAYSMSEDRRENNKDNIQDVQDCQHKYMEALMINYPII